MRKSGRLASIHDDDISEDSNTTVPPTTAPVTLTTLKKFTPTIPAVRRKKEVVEVDPGHSAVTTDTVKPLPGQGSRQIRRPLNVPLPANVSGPLSLGPASAPRSSVRSSSSSGSSSGGGIFSAVRSISRSNGSTSQSPLVDSVSIEEEFANSSPQIVEDSELLKPVVLLDVKRGDSVGGLSNFDPESSMGKLFLFQMPPVLPSLLLDPSQTQAQAQEHIQELSSDSETTEKWSSKAQGRYGKLCRYKSGRFAIVLENGFEFTLNPSIESTMEAHNTSVLAIDPEFGQSFNLGHLQAKLVAVPEFEKLQNCKN